MSDEFWFWHKLWTLRLYKQKD